MKASPPSAWIRSYERYKNMCLGYSHGQATELHNVSERTITRWVNSFNDQGIDGLIDRARAGRLRKNHPEVFSSFYHFIPEHVPREIFVKVAHLMKNTLCLIYTAFALLRDPQLGYPESLLARITELQLPDGNIFGHIGSPETLAEVSRFIAEVIDGLGFEDHYIHDLIKYDVAFNSIQSKDTREGATLIRSFSHDVIAFIKQTRANGFRDLPDIVRQKESAAVFRKLPDDVVDCTELPAVFKISQSNLRFGTP